MNDLEVRIVELEPMRVASALGFGESPELEAWQLVQEFAERHSLFDDPETRNFGFNNPDPSPGSPNYGYEIWLTVPPEVKGEGKVEIKDIPGGLYAVTRFKDISNIGSVWKLLAAWREDSDFKPARHQWLEELLTPVDVPPEEYVFDLYLPISR